jgi:hypothetical protein
MLGSRSEASTRRISAATRFFQIRDDHLIAERRRLRLQDGLDLAHHGQDMKPGSERARELDRRKQRLVAGSFVIEVNGDQNIFVHVSLALSFAITGV